MLFAQYMCCSPSMEVQIEETGNRLLDINNSFLDIQNRLYIGYSSIIFDIQNGTMNTH